MQSTSACGGNITSDGGETIIARGVCWSKNQTPGLSDSLSSDGTGAGNYKSSLSGLSPNTTCYLRAYATNSAGTGYGDIKTFSTHADTLTVTDIDGNVYYTVTIGSQV